MSGANVKIDSREFVAQLHRLKARSKRSMRTLLNLQAKGFVMEVMHLTPPGNKTTFKGPQFGAAKKRGLRNVRNDIAVIMRGTSVAKKIQRTDIERIHANARKGKRGRTLWVRKERRFFVPRDAMTAYIKRKQDDVGKLAAGWNEAANRFGFRPPEWIAKHGTSNSGVIINAGRETLKIKITNKVQFASSVDKLQSRVQVSLTAQARKMKRWVDSAIADDAKKAGLTAKS